MQARPVGLLVLLTFSLALIPLAAKAAQVRPRPKIGVLMLGAPPASPDWKEHSPFLQELRRLGWLEGQHVTVEYRSFPVLHACFMPPWAVRQDGPRLAVPAKCARWIPATLDAVDACRASGANGLYKRPGGGCPYPRPRKGVTLDGLKIKGLLHEGHKYCWRHL